MVMSKTQKKVADRLMRMTMHSHIKKNYFKKGTIPTTEQIIQDIDKQALSTLMANGYTEDDIKGMITDIIRRQKCKE